MLPIKNSTHGDQWPKRVALIHDWLLNFRGGERVLEAFCEMYPQAEIYTLFYEQGSTSKIIESHPIYSSKLNSLRSVNRSLLLPFLPWAMSNIEWKNPVDLIISSSHCVAKSIHYPFDNSPIHISYIHSPMRYIYDQFSTYFKGQSSIKKSAAQVARTLLQTWDWESNQNVDFMLANGHFVKNRIQQYYNISADVLNPFVDSDCFEFKPDPHFSKQIRGQNYFMTLSALVPNKRVDLAIQAFNETEIPLKIIGSGEQEDDLKNLSKNHIEFLGNLPREQVLNYLYHAQALIFPGIEDFGITPLESLSLGTPVIAFKQGGVLETLDEETGVFFHHPNKEDLILALNNFIQKKDLYSNRNKLQNKAQHYSKEAFKKNFSLLLESYRLKKFGKAVSKQSSLPPHNHL